MRNLPVHWSEGMFLRPQHFQACDRYWEEAVGRGQRWDSHYNYGLRTLQFSSKAIQHQAFEVTECQARLRDGTLVTLDAGQQPLRVELADAFAKKPEIMIYLAIPKLALGRANAAISSDGLERYVVRNQSMQEESAGGNDQEVQLRDLNAKLMYSGQELTGFETLELARLKRAGEQEAIPQVDRNYFPPSLALDAWGELGRLVRSIYDILGTQIDVLGQRVANRGMNFASQEPGDLEDLFKLHTLNAGFATLRCLSFALGVHPLVAYTELCRIVGMLAIFGKTRVVSPDIPEYDHDDLARIFRWVQVKISEVDSKGGSTSYEMQPFIGTDLGMNVAIKTEWLHAGWNWYVGVFGENVNERECKALLERGRLNWKLGSSNQVDMIFRYGLPGVEMEELRDSPRLLPSNRGWTFYQVTRHGNAWNDVLATQTLEMRFAMESIGNRERLRGERVVEVITPNNTRAMMQFALFAVPPVQKS